MRSSVAGGPQGEERSGQREWHMQSDEGMKSVLRTVRSSMGPGPGGVAGQVRGMAWTLGNSSIPAGVERTSPPRELEA